MKLFIALFAGAALAAGPGMAQQALPKPPGIPAGATFVPATTSGFDNRNGSLSATIVLISADELPEFDKPIGNPPVIHALTTAKAGDKVAVKILFDGPQMDSGGNIDVTYDVKVLTPSGAVYPGTDNLGLEAVQAHVGNTNALYDNRNVVLHLRFEKGDQLGVYSVEVVLHDNIAKVDIPLSATIELVE